jgi:hypothetical protein
MNGPNWTYWLMMMNFAMALVVVLAGLTVLVAVVWELREGRLRRARWARSADKELSAMLRSESHRIPVPGLGLTMADGGEELEASDNEPWDAKPRRK